MQINRGSPVNNSDSRSYVTAKMTVPDGFTALNNDFWHFSTIFRYSRVKAVELLIDVDRSNQGADWNDGSNANTRQCGQLLVKPFAGQPGYLDSYTAGFGELYENTEGGMTTWQAWQREKGCALIDLDKGKKAQVYKIPLTPIQPTEFQQTNGQIAPVGTEQQINYGPTPTVDIFSFLNNVQNHNGYLCAIVWHHPDWAGIANNVRPGNGFVNVPVIKISFRVTMEWFGLLGPDVTPGITPPLARIMALPQVKDILAETALAVQAYRDQISDQVAASCQDAVAGIGVKRRHVEVEEPDDMIDVDGSEFKKIKL